VLATTPMDTTKTATIVMVMTKWVALVLVMIVMAVICVQRITTPNGGIPLMALT